MPARGCTLGPTRRWVTAARAATPSHRGRRAASAFSGRCGAVRAARPRLSCAAGALAAPHFALGCSHNSTQALARGRTTLPRAALAIMTCAGGQCRARPLPPSALQSRASSQVLPLRPLRGSPSPTRFAGAWLMRTMQWRSRGPRLQRRRAARSRTRRVSAARARFTRFFLRRQRARAPTYTRRQRTRRASLSSSPPCQTQISRAPPRAFFSASDRCRSQAACAAAACSLRATDTTLHGLMRRRQRRRVRRRAAAAAAAALVLRAGGASRGRPLRPRRRTFPRPWCGGGSMGSCARRPLATCRSTRRCSGRWACGRKTPTWRLQQIPARRRPCFRRLRPWLPAQPFWGRCCRAAWARRARAARSTQQASRRRVLPRVPWARSPRRSLYRVPSKRAARCCTTPRTLGTAQAAC